MGGGQCDVQQGGGLKIMNYLVHDSSRSREGNRVLH